MDELTTLRELLLYNDDMNRRLLDAAAPLSDEQLDRPFDIGMGTLRKTLAHILIAEKVWLERQRGHGETKWPPYDTTLTPAEMAPEFSTVAAARDAFLDVTTPAKLEASQRYRDSKGSEFRVTLHDMLMQSIVHSAHHRAQAVHLLRRVGGEFVEVDFMYSRRRTVD